LERVKAVLLRALLVHKKSPDFVIEIGAPLPAVCLCHIAVAAIDLSV